MEILKSLLKFIVTLLCGCYIATYGIGLFFIASKFMAYSWWWLLLLIPIASLITMYIFGKSIDIIQTLSLKFRTRKIDFIEGVEPEELIKLQKLNPMLCRELDSTNIFLLKAARYIVNVSCFILLFIFPMDIITTNIGQGFAYYFGAAITFIAIYAWNRNAL